MPVMVVGTSRMDGLTDVFSYLDEVQEDRSEPWEPDDNSKDRDHISSTSSVLDKRDESPKKQVPHQNPAVCTEEMPSSTIDESHLASQRYADKNANCSRRCQICNDMASGFHYGVWSCEGCKAFFKRSLQGPVDYVCPATNACTIDKHRRKSCQSCRLRKCIEMGMNRGRKGPRGPRGPNKRKQLAEINPTTTTLEPRLKQIKKEVVEVTTCADATSIHPLVEYLLKIDPPSRNSGHDSSLPDTHLSIMSSIMRVADSELVDVINWAKSMPGYTDLQLQERIHLLEASWMEVLLMGLLWRSISHNDTLIFAPDLHIDKKRSQVCGFGSVCSKLMGLARTFAEITLHKEEFVLLRALLLFNAEIGMVSNIAKMEAPREKLIDALHFTSTVRLSHRPERVSRLLLLLPHVRQCSLSAISHMAQLQYERSMLSLELLQEMLDASRPDRINPPPPPPPPESMAPQPPSQQQHSSLQKEPIHLAPRPAETLAVGGQLNYLVAATAGYATTVRHSQSSLSPQDRFVSSPMIPQRYPLP